MAPRNPDSAATDALAEAMAAHQAGRTAEAARGYEAVLAAEPDCLAALHYLGVLKGAAGAPARAAELLSRAAALAPEDGQIRTNLALAQRRAGDWAAARASAEAALALGDDPTARYTRALAAQRLNAPAVAAAELDTLLAQQGEHVQLLVPRGRAALALDEPAAAADFLGRAQARAPDDATIATLRGQALLTQDDPAGALAALDQAGAAGAGQARWQKQRGRALRRQGALEAAAQALGEAARRAPEDPGAPAEQAAVLHQLDQLGAAAEAAETARARYEARSPQGTGVRARLLAEIAAIRRAQSRMAEAQAALREALALDPDLESAHSYLLLCLHYDVTQTEESICAAYRAWGARHAAPIEARATAPPMGAKDKAPLTVGLLVGELRRHPQGWLWLRAYENLDPAEIRLIVYDLGTEPDDMTRRVQAVATAWRDVSGLDAAAIAARVRADAVDILVHKMAHADGRPLVLAHKPAPVRVQWGGFNTTGMASVGWYLGDPVETPPASEPHFTETIYRLPDDYAVFTPPTGQAPPVGPLPAATAGHVTFACFNQPAKLTSGAVALWARVLAAVPDSVLLLKGKALGDPQAGAALRQRLVALGLPDERLILEGAAPHRELLARYNAVDIALDPWPYSGGLTTCEAMWMGVPTVTLPGPSFVGRHAATHLTAAGLGDWVVSSSQQYAEKARAWAEDPAALAALRARLRQQVADSPLSDGPRFGRNLTAAFYAMWCRSFEARQHGGS